MKALKLCSLALILLVLAACQVTVDVGMPPGFSVSNASFETNFRATVDGQERYVICDNRTTTLSYRFDYSGTLTSWSSYLRGQTTGTIRGRETFTSADINTPGRVEVTYTIPRNQAPLSDGLEIQSAISPESIIVVPRPTVIGFTQLWLDINGTTRSFNFNNQGRAIPVIDGC